MDTILSTMNQIVCYFKLCIFKCSIYIFSHITLNNQSIIQNRIMNIPYVWKYDHRPRKQGTWYQYSKLMQDSPDELYETQKVV
jgi:hypothetical protein